MIVEKCYGVGFVFSLHDIRGIPVGALICLVDEVVLGGHAGKIGKESPDANHSLGCPLMDAEHLSHLLADQCAG